jgi:hypothetical protein
MVNHELEKHLLECLYDATLYVAKGHEEAGVEILLEEEEGFAANPELMSRALELINRAYLQLTDEEDMNAANSMLDRLFSFASNWNAALNQIEAGALVIYKKALVASSSSATPLKRVFRHTDMTTLLRCTRNLVGAVAECGCARGLSTIQIAMTVEAERQGWMGDGLHVIDSFQGLSEPSSEDLDTQGMDRREATRVLSMTRRGEMSYEFEEVSRRIWSRYPGAALHKGWIPEALSKLPEQRYRFVNVDVDLHVPTLASFEYFFPRLVEGGVVVTDDYNWPGCRRAVDVFCARRGLSPAFTPNGLAYVTADRSARA